MLRSALALLSTLQVGAGIRESFERSLRQGAVIAVATVLILAAAGLPFERLSYRADPAYVACMEQKGFVRTQVAQ